MNELMYIEALEKGVEYSVKLTFKSRKTRVFFETSRVSEHPDNLGSKFYVFNSKSGNIFVTDDHIESIEIAKPLKEKEKTGKTCTRCLGNKVYEKFLHVNGGKCFKCNGSGII